LLSTHIKKKIFAVFNEILFAITNLPFQVFTTKHDIAFLERLSASGFWWRPIDFFLLSSKVGESVVLGVS
jgi:hypothetical protein